MLVLLLGVMATGCTASVRRGDQGIGSTRLKSEHVARPDWLAQAPNLTAVPPEAFTSPSESAVVVDATTAEKVFQALYPVRSRALAARDSGTVGLIETGSAREFDLARCHQGCPALAPVGGDVPHTFSAPPQVGYPAFFVARVSRIVWSEVPGTEIVVFTRTTFDAPWLIALATTSAGPNPILDDANLGMATPVPDLPGPDPAVLPAELAAYWQHWWEKGSAPPATDLARNAALAARGLHIAQVHQAEPWVETKRYDADPSAGTFVVRAVGDIVLACGVVRFRSTNTRAPGGPALHQQADRGNFGVLLEPGDYERVDYEGLEQDCFLKGHNGLAAAFYDEPLRTRVVAQARR